MKLKFTLDSFGKEFIKRLEKSNYILVSSEKNNLQICVDQLFVQFNNLFRIIFITPFDITFEIKKKLSIYIFLMFFELKLII